MEVQRPGEAEPPDEKDGNDESQEYKGEPEAYVQYPVKQHDKTQAKEAGTDVGDEHCPPVKSRLREIILTAFRAVFVLLERHTERKRAGGE